MRYTLWALTGACLATTWLLVSCMHRQAEPFDWGLDKRPVQVEYFAPEEIAPVVEEWPEPTFIQDPIPEDPKPRVRTARVIVTACSPQDPIDSAYYRRHGYKGAIYNIAADYSVFPKGTLIRVPGYMDKSYPGKWWKVDAPGGSIIRRATRRGQKQIDVKYRTYYSSKKWGRKVLTIEYILPEDQ